jgi:tRNA-specific 2-thiouridylase
MPVAVRVRSTSLPQPATLFLAPDGAKVLLRDGEYGVAAGQACVFYADTGPEARVLGGGWIGRVWSPAEQLPAASAPAGAAPRDVERVSSGH